MLRLTVWILLVFSPFLWSKDSPPIATVLPSQTAAPLIVLDPGHGGTDRGAKGKNPFCEEKRLSLQTALLVKRYLEQIGYRVVMTRATDAFIPLPRRVEIAHQACCQIFVSIHFNASPNPGAQGVEIYFCDTKGGKKRATSSKHLADSILLRLLRRTAAVSRGVKKGNFYVIREANVPAILIEGGFISNAKERTLLKTPLYQQKLARGIAEGVDSYFKRKMRPRRESNPRPAA